MIRGAPSGDPRVGRGVLELRDGTEGALTGHTAQMNYAGFGFFAAQTLAWYVVGEASIEIHPRKQEPRWGGRRPCRRRLVRWGRRVAGREGQPDDYDQGKSAEQHLLPELEQHYVRSTPADLLDGPR